MKETFMLLFMMIALSSFSQLDENSVKRFEGEITQLDSITYKFDDKVILVINTSTEFSGIFELGLLYPDLFISAEYTGDTQEETEDSDSSGVVIELEDDSMFDSIFGSDSLTISDLECISSSRNKRKTKQFSFLLFRQGLANPTEYTLILNNANSYKNMDMKTFIKGARLVEIKAGSILI
jgi:hypothetical protein